MVAIEISEFRANMDTFLPRVRKGETITLLLRDKAVAKLVPPDYARMVARQTLNELRQTAVVGYIVSPIAET